MPTPVVVSVAAAFEVLLVFHEELCGVRKLYSSYLLG
jgi:hypothetical protein